MNTSNDVSPPTPSTPATPPAPDPADRGSLGKGVGLFFLCVIGGTVAVWIIGAVLNSIGLPMQLLSLIFGGLGLLPWVAALVLALRAASAGRTRTAIGIAVGFGIFAGIVLLLVAACFGLMMNSNWH